MYIHCQSTINNDTEENQTKMGISGPCFCIFSLIQLHLFNRIVVIYCKLFIINGLKNVYLVINFFKHIHIIMKKTVQILLLVVSGILYSKTYAQLAYTTDQYSFSEESNVVYGTALGFDSFIDTLKLDIYKPVGDDNCNRPVLVLVHGGSWITGSKDEGYVPEIAEMFAKRGWVVATINYRLGMHKSANHTQYAFCPAEPCSYFADSSEIIRALYRGQQDLKGAIRFMKNRNSLDSIDIGNCYVAGESAGAFNALAATFLDDPSEKFPQVLAIEDAPTPDPDLVSCLEPGYSLSRPDLGDIDGNLNLGGSNSSVQGVGSIYGAILNVDILQNVTSWPAIYLFHQGSDVVVNYNYGKLLGRMDWECFASTNLCQTYSVAPNAYGGKGIRNYLQGLSTPPVLTADIIENYSYGEPSSNCTENGHSIDNVPIRIQRMIETFADRIESNGNLGPQCGLSVEELSTNQFLIYPNPAKDEITISNVLAGAQLDIFDILGKLVYSQEVNVNQTQTITINTSDFMEGIYLVRCTENNKTKYKKLVISK